MDWPLILYIKTETAREKIHPSQLTFLEKGLLWELFMVLGDGI